MDQAQRIRETVKIGFQRMCGKIDGQQVVIDNEASLQLQFASILKSLGDLYEETPDERFKIELEKEVRLSDGSFQKSGSSRARIDIWLAIEDRVHRTEQSCAIELKYFKKSNQREPNNRYDVFRDLQNLERYCGFTNYGVLIVATDHSHYVSKNSYSKSTGDFDFRQGSEYKAGTILTYDTPKPYGEPITLQGDYFFEWNQLPGGLSFLFLEVVPSQ